MGNSAAIQMRDAIEAKQSKSSKLSFESYKRVVSFLCLKDILSLAATCKLYQQYQQQNQQQFAQLYYDQFLNDQLVMVLEISYPDISYRTQLRNRIFQNTNTNWLQLYKQSFLLRQSTSNSTSRQKTKMPINFTELSCPKPILRRETIGMYSESDHQAMLSQRLELEQKGFDKLFDFQIVNQEFMKYLKENKHTIIQKSIQDLMQSENLKQQFLSKRWVLEVTQFSEKEIQTSTEKTDVLDWFLDLYSSVECYLQGLSEYLMAFEKQEPKNAIDILLEYYYYWQAFCNSVLEIQSLIIPFEEIVNEIYKEVYPEYPQYPKYSVWRQMIKLWISIINQKDGYQDILEECFLKIIKHQRQKILNNQFEQKTAEQQELYITHELYNNFAKQKKMSLFVTYNIETTHHCYEDITELLGGFCKAIQDISLNEVSVHWIGHTQFKYEEIYEQFTRRILEQSSQYYDEQKGIFEDDIEQYINFLQMDSNYLSTFLSEALMYQVQNLQKEHIFTIMSYHIKNEYISKFIENREEQIQKIYGNIKQDKQDRISITSSQNNDHLDTQGDTNLNDVQKLFTFALDNIHADFDEMILKEKQKHEPDPIQEIIRVSLSDFQLEIDMIVNSDYIMPMPQQLVRSFSQKKRCQSENYEFPDELIKAIHSYMLEILEFSKLNSCFQNYYHSYDKLLVKYYQRDEEIRLINEDRELPIALPEYLQDFYYVSRQLMLETLEQNKAEDPQLSMEDDMDMPSLSKSSSKLQKSMPPEEYISDTEEDPQDCNQFKDQ